MVSFRWGLRSSTFGGRIFGFRCHNYSRAVGQRDLGLLRPVNKSHFQQRERTTLGSAWHSRAASPLIVDLDKQVTMPNSRQLNEIALMKSAFPDYPHSVWKVRHTPSFTPMCRYKTIAPRDEAAIEDATRYKISCHTRCRIKILMPWRSNIARPTQEVGGRLAPKQQAKK